MSGETAWRNRPLEGRPAALQPVIATPETE